MSCSIKMIKKLILILPVIKKLIFFISQNHNIKELYYIYVILK